MASTLQAVMAAVAAVAALAVGAMEWPDPGCTVLAGLCLALSASVLWLRLQGGAPPAMAGVPLGMPELSELATQGAGRAPAAALTPAPQGARAPRAASRPDSPRAADVTSRVAAPMPVLARVPASDLVPALREGPQRRLSILVTDDHDVNRALLAGLIDALGHEAHFAADGEEALAAVRENGFDIVLMDLAMPRLDGLGATRAIRALADSRRATVPIVALTADEAPDIRGRCLLMGMNDFLTKPIGLDDLAACLRRLFGDDVAQLRRPSAGGGMLDTDSPALVDHQTLNAVLGSLGHERARELLAQLFGETPRTVTELRAALRDAQPQSLKVLTHGLRGAALNLGLAAVAATASALNEGASHLAAHEVAMLVRRLEGQLQQTRQALAAMGLLEA